MGMRLADEDLLPGEIHVMTKGANMVISVKESGLSKFAGDDWMGLVGMAGKESIGGLAHLTNYRIIFKAHFFNRMRGKHSIFLPNVLAVSTTLNNLYVETNVQQFEFVMWGKKPFVDAIGQQKAVLEKAGQHNLKMAVTSHPEALGVGLRQWATAKVINQILLDARGAQSVVENLSGTDKNTFIEVIELFRSGDQE